MKILVISTAISTRSFPARDGKAAMNFREQKAAIERPGDFPLPFSISLDEDQNPYPVGEYELHPSSLQNNKFGGLEFTRRIKFTAFKPAPSAKAA